MNTLHLKEIDWRQYLDTPTEPHSEWLENVYQAFCRGFIDYADIHLAYQTFGGDTMGYWDKMLKEERRQDMERARIYKEQHRK